MESELTTFRGAGRPGREPSRKRARILRFAAFLTPNSDGDFALPHDEYCQIAAWAFTGSLDLTRTRSLELRTAAGPR